MPACWTLFVNRSWAITLAPRQELRQTGRTMPGTRQELVDEMRTKKGTTEPQDWGKREKPKVPIQRATRDTGRGENQPSLFYRLQHPYLATTVFAWPKQSRARPPNELPAARKSSRWSSHRQKQWTTSARDHCLYRFVRNHYTTPYAGQARRPAIRGFG